MEQKASADRAAPAAALGLLDAVCIMVGIIVGAGIFETAPTVAAQFGSWEGVLLMWLAGGAVSLCGAWCYAELATAYPEDGGDYHYLNRALGRWAGYLFAWGQFVIVRPGSIAAISYPFGRYLSALWSPLAGTRLAQYEWSIFAAAAVMVLTALNCLNVNTGKWTQNLLTLAKCTGLMLIVAAAFLAPAHPAAGTFAPDAPSLGLALILVLFTYGGWNEIAYVAAEVRDAARAISRALMLCIALVTAVYLLVNAAFLRTLGLAGVAASPAVAVDAVARFMPAGGGRLISLLICVSALGAANGMIFTGARIAYALGSEHALFRRLGSWDARRGTPRAALLAQGALSLAVVLLAGSFSATVVYTSAVVWVFFSATGVAYFVLHYRREARPYRAPFYPLPGLIYCASSVYVCYSALRYDWRGSVIAVCITAAGLLFYRSRGIREPNPDVS